MSRTKFYDPTGTQYGIPTYPFRLAPDGLATTRQLRARGLRPGGQEPAAQVLWLSRRYRTARGGSPVRAAYLYHIDRALPVRPMTDAKRAALTKANAARRVCPDCRRDRGYTIPTSLGTCAICAGAPAALAA